MIGGRRWSAKGASAAAGRNSSEKCPIFPYYCGSTAGFRVVQLRKAVVGTVAFGRKQGGGWDSKDCQAEFPPSFVSWHDCQALPTFWCSERLAAAGYSTGEH
jgi:hypothetical protein